MKDWDQDSNIIKFDCDKLGVRSDLIQFGNDPTRGQYRLITTISNDYNEPSFKETYKVFSPVDTKYQSYAPANFEKNSYKAVVLKSLVNAFNTNDMEGGDEISLAVYSDVTDDIFKCGRYNFRSGDAVDFNDLVIPCREVITITLSENDGSDSDGHTILVPCNSNTEMTLDLIIHKGVWVEDVDKLTSVQNIISFLGQFNPF